MSAVRRCDNCGAVEDLEDRDALLWWVRVGWFAGGDEEACSLTCARGLLDSFEQTRWEFESELPDEDAESEAVSS